MRRAVVGALAALLAVGGPASGAATASTPGRPAVVEVRVIGYSVKHRPIYAWRLGDRHAATKAVVIAAMHGNEAAPRQILRSLRDGAPVSGVDLWLVPTMNPDGVARHARQNARGVDLNRNFPYDWKPLSSPYYSGAQPRSEPETRVIMRFLSRVAPRYIVSFHQPLYGVDTYGPKSRAFTRRLSVELELPRKDFRCSGACHGTLTGWYNHAFPGVAVTVEYGERPTWRRMNVRAPRQLLAALGGTR